MVECTEAHCNILEDEEENESYFEEHFWFFIGPSSLLLTLSIIINLFNNFIILSQILAIIAALLSVYGIFREAIENLLEKKINVNLLMIIAAIGSFIILHAQEGATVIVLYAIAVHIEEVTTEKSRKSLKELLELAPDIALLKSNGNYVEIPSEKVKKGDILGIKPGMKVPLDGIIIKGQSYFNESAITGESVPIYKKEGDEVFAASINQNDFVEIEVTKVKNETVVAKIAETVKSALLNKSKHERFIERFAKYYTPFIILASLIIILVPWLIFNLNFYDWFYRGLVLLVVSCPCALTLSTPLANITALTKLAREGILVKGNKYIEIADKIKIIAFDKTGTLTEGKLRVFEIKSIQNKDTQLLKIAASLEALSEHPIAKAIVDFANELKIPLLNVDNFKVIKGKGIKGQINGENFIIGNKRFIKENGIHIPKEFVINNDEGMISIYVSTDKKLIGVLLIRDVLRISSPILINGLKKRGIKAVMISGDDQKVCNVIGKCIDLQNVYGELLPNEKLEMIKTLKLKEGNVAMVGDGINDAPSLALSDLGIAIGASATDLTLQTSDVVIMGDDLSKILVFFDITKKTNKIIKQNIWTSIIIKLSFAILTIFGLMTLWLAVGIGDMGVSLGILLNGMRIFRYRNKFKDLPIEKLESRAKTIICNTCKTKNIIPQHHGRDMIQFQDKLVCWRKILNSAELEPCEEEIVLNCPVCNGKLELN